VFFQIPALTLDSVSSEAHGAFLTSTEAMISETQIDRAADVRLVA
jgi:hypothetical protein